MSSFCYVFQKLHCKTQWRYKLKLKEQTKNEWHRDPLGEPAHSTGTCSTYMQPNSPSYQIQGLPPMTTNSCRLCPEEHSWRNHDNGENPEGDSNAIMWPQKIICRVGHRLRTWHWSSHGCQGPEDFGPENNYRCRAWANLQGATNVNAINFQTLVSSCHWQYNCRRPVLSSKSTPSNSHQINASPRTHHQVTTSGMHSCLHVTFLGENILLEEQIRQP